MHRRAQTPEFLDGLFRAGNDHRIKTEKKPSQRGGYGPKENLFFHNVRVPSSRRVLPDRLEFIHFQRFDLRGAAVAE